MSERKDNELIPIRYEAEPNKGLKPLSPQSFVLCIFILNWYNLIPNSIFLNFSTIVLIAYQLIENEVPLPYLLSTTSHY